MSDLPHESRGAAIELVLAAFDTASYHRVNTPREVTLAQAGLALYELGVTQEELIAAAQALGVETPGGGS